MIDPALKRFHLWLVCLRATALLLIGLIGAIWVSSYFVGVQRYQSIWSASATGLSEDARWLFSNHGSFGFAWRSQRSHAAATDSVPPDELYRRPSVDIDFKTFESSSDALGHVHPEGFIPWHWIVYQPMELSMIGSTSTGYGHLFIPYWIPFLTSVLWLFIISVCFEPSPRQGPNSKRLPGSATHGGGGRDQDIDPIRNASQTI